MIEGTLQGKAFDLPAGEVRVAMGVQYRENSYRFDLGSFAREDKSEVAAPGG
ncbi:hypothetical protein [Brevundimonas vancanneytii]|uniref:Uncharacterized protein n=1 Tax=Brevundimonas vancanneytii TaxID=1325724 RepID=A0A4P1K4M2_9CAUL|nr:hypothetical protein [Brevundimonas vancanneytii]VTO15320.1 Uncharacterised protein [Brevundimonas vancanneytii]